VFILGHSGREHRPHDHGYTGIIRMDADRWPRSHRGPWSIGRAAIASTNRPPHLGRRRSGTTTPTGRDVPSAIADDRTGCPIAGGLPASANVSSPVAGHETGALAGIFR